MVPETHAEGTFKTRSEDSVGVEGLEEAEDRSVDTNTESRSSGFRKELVFARAATILVFPAFCAQTLYLFLGKNDIGKICPLTLCRY